MMTRHSPGMPMSWMRTLVAGLLLSSVTAQLAAAQGSPTSKNDNRTHMLADRYARPRTYDLVHQDITLSNFNWQTQSFTGNVVTTLVLQREGQDTIWMDAGAGLTIATIADSRGTPMSFVHRKDSLGLAVPKSVKIGDSLRFAIAYSSHSDSTVQLSERGIIFIQDDPGNPRHPQQLWSQGADANSHRWFPTYDTPNDKTTWDVTATVPTEYMVVSNGQLIDDKPAANGQHTVHWRQPLPASTYLVSLIVAPLVTVHDTVHLKERSVPLEYNVYAPDTAIARTAYAHTKTAMILYEQLTGVTYPWPRYAQTEVADFVFGGMENVGATTMFDQLYNPWFGSQLVTHELAHQWFGNYTTNVDFTHVWLNESFATFMTGQYLGATNGVRAEQDYFFDRMQEYFNTDASGRRAMTGLTREVVHPKGSATIEMLKWYLGPKDFWASIHTYLTTHALNVASSQDLARAIKKTTGQDVDAFFDEWVYGAGYPKFTITQTYDSVARQLTLQVAQTHVARADTLIQTAGEPISPKQPLTDTTIYTTPSVFHMPVTIRVATAKGDRTVTANLNARTQSIVIDQLPAAPTMVVFDTSDAIMKDVYFEQPTAWLVALLTSEPTTWQTWWAIKELRARPKDAEAQAALARARTQGKYERTRTWASEN